MSMTSLNMSAILGSAVSRAWTSRLTSVTLATPSGVTVDAPCATCRRSVEVSAERTVSASYAKSHCISWAPLPVEVNNINVR